MKVQFEIVPVGDTCIIQIAVENGSRSTLAEGFANQQQALDALVECLTYSAPPPPDLSIVDEAVAAAGALVDRVADLEGGLQSLGERVIAIEEAGTPKLAKAAAGLLGKVRSTAVGSAGSAPVPSIRRPRSVSIGMESGGGNTGRAKMPIMGRAIRPGDPANEDFAEGEEPIE